MTFKEFLRANRLPPIGATLMTPNGSKHMLIRYEFEEDKEYAVVELDNGMEIYWTFNQIAKCDWWKKDKEVNNG